MANDHRLRVLFPTGALAKTYLAESAFDVVERSIALRLDNDRYRELEIETKPQQNWTAVFDENRGLAVISTGLRESAVRDLPERPIALTLFRGTRRTTFTAGEPNGQQSGRLSFEYCIQPLQGPPDRTELCERAQRLAAGVRTSQLRASDQHLYRSGASIPAMDSYIRLAGAAVMTSARHVGDGLEVRVFNPLTIDASCVIAPNAHFIGRDAFTAESVNLESRSIESLAIENGAAVLALAPKKIATVRFAKATSS
jgi:alpha-mannosidase/mannosylglycerate hydrolase